MPVAGTETDSTNGSAQQDENDKIMKDCANHRNTGLWFPGVNDCHNKVERCLVRNGLKSPPKGISLEDAYRPSSRSATLTTLATATKQTSIKCFI